MEKEKANPVLVAVMWLFIFSAFIVGFSFLMHFGVTKVNCLILLGAGCLSVLTYLTFSIVDKLKALGGKE